MIGVNPARTFFALVIPLLESTALGAFCGARPRSVPTACPQEQRPLIHKTIKLEHLVTKRLLPNVTLQKGFPPVT